MSMTGGGITFFLPLPDFLAHRCSTFLAKPIRPTPNEPYYDDDIEFLSQPTSITPNEPPNQPIYTAPNEPPSRPTSTTPSPSNIQPDDTILNDPSALDSTAKRKGRGPTHGIGLCKMKKALGKKLTITIDVDQGRPTDRVQLAKFSSEVGFLAREFMRVPKGFKDLNEDDLNPAFDRLQERCSINATNRAKAKMSHKTGSMSFEAMRHEINEMQRLLAESEAEGNSMIVDEICNKVLGVCSGYVRGLGHGPKPYQASSSKFKVNQLEERLKESRLENHQLKDDVHELRESTGCIGRFGPILISCFVKTHLEEYLCVKVADFGSCRLPTNNIN
ncbi:hypothetical protein COCNU_08G000260 [Cocos nucifera]|uniref:Uncharacterized protein n=1 Tax=Cocos nucifera TaxID=13894 RepID=A0A8K0IH30_COCNU|nr:hypothetical protein COCNU_08G000260 [Cocos nucifera]